MVGVRVVRVVGVAAGGVVGLGAGRLSSVGRFGCRLGRWSLGGGWRGARFRGRRRGRCLARRLAASIQRGLGESGLAVDVVHEGNDGIAAVLSTPYDVVVMDVMLPGADGLTVSRQLRQQKVSAPILMLTARDAVDDRVRGL